MPVVRLGTLMASAFAMLLLSACHTSFRQAETGGTAMAGARLDAQRAVMIAVPKDGGYGERTSIGSGQMVAQRTAAAFSKHAPRVDLAAAGVNDNAALLEAARKAGAGYLVVPAIASWEQRATEWSGRPSRASVGMAIFDVETGQEIRSTVLDSASRRMTLTSTSPEALLPRMVGKYVDSLYDKPQQPEE